MTATTTQTGSRFLRQAIELAVENVAEGGGPFGAVIAKDDRLIVTGENRVTRDNDPSAHAEITAIRRAAKVLGSFSLAGCVLYTSCEPCPMCASTALWARLDGIVFAADRDDAARGGFDDSRFWNLMCADYTEWDIPIRFERVPTLFDPFTAWTAATERVDY